MQRSLIIFIAILYHNRLIDCSTRIHPRLFLCCYCFSFLGVGSCYLMCSFLCSVLQIVVCPFSICAIVLFVLPFTDLASSNTSFKYIGYMFTIVPQQIQIKNKIINRVRCVMVSVHNSSEVGRWFEPQSGKKKTNHISICCFFAKNAILR